MQDGGKKRHNGVPWARLLLAGLLFVMAAGQASNFSGFITKIGDYQVPIVADGLLGGVLFSAELFAAVGLVSSAPRHRQIGGAVAFGVALVWSVLASQAFLRNLVLDNCGCFGVHLAQPLRWWILLEDAEFLIWSALVWRAEKAKRPVAQSQKEHTTAPVLAACVKDMPARPPAQQIPDRMPATTSSSPAPHDKNRSPFTSGL